MTKLWAMREFADPPSVHLGRQSMDVAAAVNELALQVHEVHLSPLRYIADPERDPLQLPVELGTMRGLIHRLQTKVHGMVPHNIYAHHLQQSYDIEAQLRALEDGLVKLQARGEIVNRTRAQRAPGAIPEDELQHLFDIDMTDKEIAELYGCSPRTVYRRRKSLGMLRRAAMPAMTDRRLAQVIFC